MTDRPAGSTIRVEVARAEEVMSVAGTEGVSVDSLNEPVIGPEDGPSESVRASVGATSEVVKPNVVPGSEAFIL